MITKKHLFQYTVKLPSYNSYPLAGWFESKKRIISLSCCLMHSVFEPFVVNVSAEKNGAL
jgi:hypothetical protein